MYAGDINNFVKKSSKGSRIWGIWFQDPNLVSSHSLQAGSTMAMHLNSLDTDTIKKFSQWLSEMFLMYIHKQILALSNGVSTAMSHNIHFQNIAGPTLKQHRSYL